MPRRSDSVSLIACRVPNATSALSVAAMRAAEMRVNALASVASRAKPYPLALAFVADGCAGDGRETSNPSATERYARRRIVRGAMHQEGRRMAGR
jgi:hypothetical protein